MMFVYISSKKKETGLTIETELNRFTKCDHKDAREYTKYKDTVTPSGRQSGLSVYHVFRRS